MDFAVILLEQYSRTCFCSAPNTTRELSVFATVDSVKPSRQTMSSVNEISSRTDVERSRGNLASHISASEGGAEVGVLRQVSTLTVDESPMFVLTKPDNGQENRDMLFGWGSESEIPFFWKLCGLNSFASAGDRRRI